MTIRPALLLALATLLPAPRAGAETLREESRHSEDVAAIRQVRVENARGLIELSPSPDGRLHLSALKIVRATEPDRRAQLARDTRVELDRAGGVWRVKVRYPQRQQYKVGLWDLFKGEFQVPQIEVRLAVQVPGAMPVTLTGASADVIAASPGGPLVIETVSGDVEVRDAAGALEIGTTSGDVSVERAARLRVRTTSGDVVAEQVAGPVRASSASGALQVYGSRDSVTLASISGDLSVDGAPRGLTARSTSGEVQVSGATAGAILVETTSGGVDVSVRRGVTRAELRSESGTIQARLAPDAGADLDLMTVSGTVDVSLPVSHAETRPKRLRGQVRGGGIPLIARSTSGDIDLTSGGK